MSAGPRIVARARGAVGARFRLHGRDPADGLDCVGLAGWALEIDALPTGYGLRGGRRASVEDALRAAGLCEVPALREGDLVLAAAGPGQWHLAIRMHGGWVHADASLRRVVERPGAAPWPVASIWRRG